MHSWLYNRKPSLNSASNCQYLGLGAINVPVIHIKYQWPTINGSVEINTSMIPK